MRKRWISATLWSAAVVLAVGAGTAAVAAASTSGGRQVLSEHDVDRQLAGTPSTSPSGTPTAARTTPESDASSQVARVSAGTVVVRCTGDTATLLRWTPKTGYRADDPTYGPAAAVSVRFESDTASDVTVTVRCPGGKAVATTVVDGDDHGHDATDNDGATASPTAGDDHGGDRHGGDDQGGDNPGTAASGSDDPAGHH